MTRRVFYSFHYQLDASRVQQIKNIGAIEGQKIVNSNEWEAVKRQGDLAIQNWIDDAMMYTSCTIVLVGEETADRKWVQYEIKHSFEQKRPIFGIYIDRIRNLQGQTARKGKNPFSRWSIGEGLNKKSLDTIIPIYDPKSSWQTPYTVIRQNIEGWIEDAIKRGGTYHV
ncbi:TIR domain-containing protein [Furfurilactobacillus cerevisiae]|uniref:TIR domain-containing protein n=1 Tax=Furfurilactobacillus rossiae TaxID=231049 RepID=UPI003B97E2D3